MPGVRKEEEYTSGPTGQMISLFCVRDKTVRENQRFRIESRRDD